MSGKASPPESERLSDEKQPEVDVGTKEAGLVDTFPDIDERKLMRKLDWALIPWLSFLYLLSFLDRTSIGNAKVRSHFLRV